MTLRTLQPLTEKEYLDLRCRFLKEIEEHGDGSMELYFDFPDQIVSTEVGCNLTVDKALELLKKVA